MFRWRPKRKHAVLVIITRFKWTHIDYLVALGEHVDLRVLVSGEVHQGAIANGIRWWLDIRRIGSLGHGNETTIQNEIMENINDMRPDIVHVMYYYHEEITLMVRKILDIKAAESDLRTALVFECRDPLSLLWRGESGAKALERKALCATNNWIFVTNATKDYYSETHGLDFSEALIVPHGFAERTVAKPSKKLSAKDGRIHIALVGSAVTAPDDSRYYEDIIRKIVAQGFVVHSHFHPLDDVENFYKALARKLDDYHAHPKLPHRNGTELSKAMSRYDLMGVFHDLDARQRNERAILRVCMPTKAVCGWLLGAIPVVCFREYGGLKSYIDDYGIGFTVESIEELKFMHEKWKDIKIATRRCIAMRSFFTHETQSRKISAFYDRIISNS